jgi:ubiquinone/menaquinone biosynthesis C-methylase UbiE
MNILFRFALLLPLLLCAACGGGGRWSEEWEESFEAFQPSEMIMNRVGMEPGMMIGEVGAGNGRFAVKVADRVGESGLVYANDIDPEALEFMADRLRRESITNMVVIHGGEVEPGFPPGELDLVYLINTYDHLSDPVTLLKNVVVALKPGGRLAIIATDSAKLEDHRGHATPRRVVIDQVTRAGYELVSLDTSFQYDNIYIFRPQRSEEPAE